MFTSRTNDYANITSAAFDERFDGNKSRSLLGICLRATRTLLLFSIQRGEDGAMSVSPITHYPALSIAPIRATRNIVADLLVLRPDGSLSLLTHGTCELPLSLTLPASSARRRIVALSRSIYSSVTLEFSDGFQLRLSLDLIARDHVVSDCLIAVSYALPTEMFFALHKAFLQRWSAKKYSFILGIELQAFEESLLHVLELGGGEASEDSSERSAWSRLAKTETFDKFCEDPVLRRLQLPSRTPPQFMIKPEKKPHALVGPVLHALHLVAEEKRVFLPTYEGLTRLAPIICRLAMIVRPEWADYWKRHCPGALPIWPTPHAAGAYNYPIRICSVLTGLALLQFRISQMIACRSSLQTCSVTCMVGSTIQIGAFRGENAGMSSLPRTAGRHSLLAASRSSGTCVR